MALFQGIQKYIALDANNIACVEDEDNIISISGNIFLYPAQGHPMLYNYYNTSRGKLSALKIVTVQNKTMSMFSTTAYLFADGFW